MNRDSGAENPGQRTVADLLKEYGGDSGGSQRGDRRRRRRAEDMTETAPHAIIDRVLSDSGQLRAIRPDEEPPPELRSGSQQASSQQAEPQQQAGPADASGTPPGMAPQSSPAPNAQRAPQPPAEPVQQSPAEPVQQSPAQPPPAQQSAGQQSAGQQPAAQQQGPVEDFASAPVGAEGANFWAQRFAAAGAPPEEQPPAAGDAEATVQQQPLSPRPQPYPRSDSRGAVYPAAQAPAAQTPAAQTPAAQSPAAAESETEKLPLASAQERAGGGTAMFAASPGAGQDTAADFGDAYDFDDVEDFGDEPYGYGPDADGGADDAFALGDRDVDDRPTGLPADDDTDDGQSPGREWVGQVAQAVVGLLCGAVIFFGFSWLWTKNSVAAFVAALAVTGCLVLLARKLRGDDLQIILLAVLAGLFCTVSPAALLMLGQ